MNKIFILIIIFFVSSCSFDTRSGFWTEEIKITEANKNISKVFKKEEITTNEFNSNLILELDNSKSDNNKNANLINNYGRISSLGRINNKSIFKFSKIKEFDYFEPELGIDNSGFTFFDSKANIIKFNNNLDTIWEQNIYSKNDIKLRPKISIFSNNTNLVAFDDIGNFFALDAKTGKILWKKKNRNPFNSEVKIIDDKILAVDLNNFLICYSLIDGSELWKFGSGNNLLKSDKRNSIVIKNEVVYYNNSLGDISALDLNDGSLLWQTPTQSSRILENAFSLILSDLVIDGNNMFFSNNRNEFYSINIDNGVVEWKQKINSVVRPIIFENFIFTVSNEGYLFVVDKETGNVLRITYIFEVFGEKKIKNFLNKSQKKTKPIGMISGKDVIYLTTNNGRLILIDIRTGKSVSMIKLDNNKLSMPFSYKQNLLIIKANSVIRLN